jgi:hypothetical protein
MVQKRIMNVVQIKVHPSTSQTRGSNMQLMLETMELGLHLNGETGQDAETNLSGAVDNWRSFAIRLGLAVGALCVAWFLMTSALPAELATHTLASVEPGSVPSPIGTLLASLH